MIPPLVKSFIIVPVCQQELPYEVLCMALQFPVRLGGGGHLIMVLLRGPTHCRFQHFIYHWVCQHVSKWFHHKAIRTTSVKPQISREVRKGERGRPALDGHSSQSATVSHSTCPESNTRLDWGFHSIIHLIWHKVSLHRKQETPPKGPVHPPPPPRI